MEIGLKFITKLYQPAKNTQELDDLRYTWYNRITSRLGLSSTFNLASLPPTKDSAIQHLLRVYCQVDELNIIIFYNYLHNLCSVGTGMDQTKGRSIGVWLGKR